LSVFLDSSALVKRYADEPGFETIRALGQDCYVSELSQVEVPSAIWRKHRTGEVSEDDALTLIAVFNLEIAEVAAGGGPFAIVIASAPVIALAAVFPARYGLRAYDAVQLATAIVAREADPALETFACADRGLGNAARREQFSLLDPALT
jgi:uncharacterized protein